MHILGKIIGGFFGYLFGGIFGAIFGLILGHRFDSALGSSNNGFAFGSGQDKASRQEAFLGAAYAVMGHVAKSKGQVKKEDIHLATIMMDRMKLSIEQRHMVQDAFRRGKHPDFPLEDELAQVKEMIGGRFDLLQFFLELQISAAFADGDLHPSERNVLHRIAKGLGFSSAQLERRLKMQEAAFRFQQQGDFGSENSGNSGNYSSWEQSNNYSNLSNAYEVLGVDKDADVKTVKRAYRKRMNEHHPDKLMSKGLPPEMMEMAKEKSQEIQKAYDLIKRAKGF